MVLPARLRPFWQGFVLACSLCFVLVLYAELAKRSPSVSAQHTLAEVCAQGAAAPSAASALRAYVAPPLAPYHVHVGVRMSLPYGTDKPAFNPQNLSAPKLRDLIYRETRMVHKLWSFKHMFLPAFAAQTDPEFDVVGYVGANMPAQWVAALRAIAEPYPFLSFVVLDHGRELPAAERARCRPAGGTHVSVRIDDDDGLHPQFVARVRQHAKEVEGDPKRRGQNATYLSFSEGIVFGYDSRGRLTLAQTHYPWFAAGIAEIRTHGDCSATVMDQGYHRDVGKRAPHSIVDAGARDMWMVLGDPASSNSGRQSPRVKQDPLLLQRVLGAYPHVPLSRSPDLSRFDLGLSPEWS